MKYINAAEVLPKDLLREIQAYVKGELLYIPQDGEQKKWGEKSGSRKYYELRNRTIKAQYKVGVSMEELANRHGLAFDTIRKIIHS